MITLIDSHCHLDLLLKAIPEEEISEILKNCAHVVVPGINLGQWQTIKALKSKDPKIHIAYGFHPIALSTENMDINLCETYCYEVLSAALQDKKAIAVGECGLDADVETPLTFQQKIFNVHLRVAEEHDLPVIIHTRRTQHLIMQSLKGRNLPASGVVHAFAGSLESAQAFIKQGFYLGIGGVITYPRAKKTRETVSKLPLERIVLETDAPYMPVFNRQGSPNRPEYLLEILGALHELRDETLETLIEQTSKNAKHLFRI